MNTIEYANLDHLDRLTEIAFSGKRHWGYPEEYYEIWETELTITEDYLKNNVVKIILENDIIKGFYSICYNEDEKHVGETFIEKGYWLDFMFLDEKFIGNGLGKIMFNDSINEIKNNGGTNFYIFSDPNAQGFYKKMGCKFIRESKSSIKNRTIPIYKYEIK